MPYLTKVAIDFGSTNTVMAWRVYNADDDFNPISISAEHNVANNVKRIPSVMILKTDNPNNDKDYFGEAADSQSRNGNITMIIRDNFKQKLYTEHVGSEKYLEGKELTSKFFNHLREVYKENIRDRFSATMQQNMRTILYLSTPVRADPSHRTLMRELAENAGFNLSNGIDRISTDSDEALCVVKYAMENKADSVKSALKNAATDKGSVMLFVDVGGSTMDMVLEHIHIIDGKLTAKPISWWPNPDVKYPLGGCLIDEAIRDYLIKNDFAIPDYTMDKWNNRDGKFRFRTFKEENNRILKENRKIDELGMLHTVIENFSKRKLAPKIYDEDVNKIDRDIFENDICKEYITEIYNAVNELFKSQSDNMTPQDVDMIFLSGAGSNLYFIKDVLLDKRNGFGKIIENKEFLFSDWEDPSQCCALGALIELEDADLPNYSKDDYTVKVRIYLANRHSSYIEQHPEEIVPEKELYEIKCNGKAGLSHKIKCIFDNRFSLANKFDKLPSQHTYENHFTFTLQDNDINFMIFQILLFRLNEKGEEHLIGSPKLQFQGLTWKQVIKDIAAGTLLIAGLPLLAIDKIAKTNSKSTVYNVYNKITGVGERISMKLTLNIELSESGSLSTQTKIISDKIFKDNVHKFQIDL